ncbi:MAG: outer membrane protein transport protein, partial [Muribaculum sp.]|nr:outer membrane protein transport protein [Muribaculum sp.]
VNLNKGLVTQESFDRFLPIAGMLSGTQMPSTIGNVVPASVNLTGDSQLAFGFNVGAMYDIDSRWTVGVSYRSKMNMKVKKGIASVSYANEALSRPVLGESLDLLNSTNFAAEMPCPYVLTFGVSYKPVEKLILAFDAQLNGWSAYKCLDIEFDNLAEYDQHLTKKYKDAWTFHLGGQYSLTARRDLRAGVMLDLSPVNRNYYNPETPGMTKIEPSVGLSFRPMPQMSIDFAFMYVFGTGADGVVGSYENLLAKKANPALDQLAQLRPELAPVVAGLKMPETGEFKADYMTRALIPAIGVSYAF